ncbi:MAG: murein hydrolase activator EnvC family protein [Actinomycetota bacterium]
MLVFAGRKSLPLRSALVATALLISVVPLIGGSAAGASKADDLRARLDEIQAELDAATAKVEAAHALEETLETRRDQLARELINLKKKMVKLEEEVAVRAAALYKSGGTGVLDVLLNSEDFAALSDSAEILSQANVDDADAFIELSRAKARAKEITEELEAKNAELQKTEELLKDQASELQAKFNAVAAEYEALKEELAESEPATVSQAAPQIKASGDMVCPVGGPTSFVDSWGAPRSGGRTHQGVDMMAAHGTPQLAIVSGTITYAGYSSLGGNVQYLSGDDGNLYVYVHQAENAVTGGHVQAGQVISYVGDTGNAAGNPHLHFEYHPGGGAAVNPYPLVASLC